MLIIENWFWL